MRTLYLECKMGVSGDMMLGTLLDLIPDKNQWIQKFNEIGIPHMRAEWRRETRCQISGTHVSIYIHGQEEHSEDLPGTPVCPDTLHGYLKHEPHDHVHPDPHHEPHDHVHPDPHHGPHDHVHPDPHHGPHDHVHPDPHHGPHDHVHPDPHHGHHSHSTLASVQEIISSLKVSSTVQKKALEIYQLLAEAEAAVPGRTVELIHFHEVGQLDAVADIVGTCMLIEELAPDRIIASPIHVGSGQVRCAHGILPVPAPATALLLKGIPFYSQDISGELCTPTGAALMRYFVDEFTPSPLVRYDRIGCGLGTKELEAANILRAFWQEETQVHNSSQRIAELRCSLDDMSPEAVGYAQELLLEVGALDVFTMAIQMKKNRPGTLLCVSCREEQADDMARLLLTHTTTAGVRKLLYDRYTLDYYFTEKEFPEGKVRLKHYTGYGIEKVKPEYQDVANIAQKTGQSYNQVFQKVLEDL